MTRLWILSDLHLEFPEYADWLPPAIPEADVCIAAGDIARPISTSVRWLAEHILPWMPVVFVPGNHEFYRSSIVEGTADGLAAAAEFSGLELLVDRAVTVRGVRFVGATLWTDYAVQASTAPPEDRDRAILGAMAIASSGMNDHSQIALQKRPWLRFLAREARFLHHRSRGFIAGELMQPFDGPTVVVTHHAPHPESIHERFASGPDAALTPAYVSDLTEVIEAGQPDLWVHGHVHDSFDYQVGRTRIVANPRGYGTENLDFDPGMVLEV
ncbi:Predicted phosphoesterase [Faunimonas pinastri]|uniref:Predicted phosphoesterase n=2 Tax=Faunimonas pinastri TaxID=1855383 RepID=A0A1H9QIH2_9HYPH|nr:Predicted phosphoesterase [Faunimonas pinastri]